LTNQLDRCTQFVLHDEGFQRAFLSGLVRVDELPSFGTTIAAMEQEIASWPSEHRSFYLSWNRRSVGHFGYTIVNTSLLRPRLNLLSACGLLRYFDLAPVSATILDHQIIPEAVADDRWQDLDTKALRGLFLMASSNPLRDTYESLSILERLGAINQVNREECIKGILRFHKGRGLFVKGVEGQPNWSIRGDAIDAFCALESLRMLGAMDRVKDWPKWLCRSQRFHATEQPPLEILMAYGLARRMDLPSLRE
jgi:hypothetical protein